MISIILYVLLTITLTFFLGIGISFYFLPKRLSTSSYSIFILPWISITAIIFILVITNLLGFTIHQTAIQITIILSCISIYVILKHRVILFPRSITIIVIIAIVGFNLLLNLSPLLVKEKFMTTISLGNLDGTVYAIIGDYLKDHTILDSLHEKKLVETRELLFTDYRWGTSVLISYFIEIFNLKGYQFVYILISILFSFFTLLIPLLFHSLFKPSRFILIVSVIFVAFNTNLLYTLYHGFFGQILYSGLYLLFLIIYTDFIRNKSITKSEEKTDILAAFILTTIYFTYQEGILFVILPVAIYLITQIISERNFNIIKSHIRFIFVLLITNSISLMHNMRFNLLMFSFHEDKRAIGWQLIRESQNYASPLELLGIHNLYLANPLPIYITILFSIPVILILMYGLLNLKESKFTVITFIVYILVIFQTSIYNPHFFLYFRVTALFLPVLFILFSGGLDLMSKKYKIPSLAVILIMVSVILWNAKIFNFYFRSNYLAVRQEVTILEELKRFQFTEPIYTENYFDTSLTRWEEIWIKYFLNVSKA